MWIAPNLITIIGLAVNVFTSLIHLYYCPTATEEVKNMDGSLRSIINKKYLLKAQSPIHVPNDAFLCIE